MAATTARQERPAQCSEAELFAALDAGQAGAREALIERFLPMARKLALRYSYTNEPLEDLVQVASMGLVKAVDRFDPGRGHSFGSFAVPTIVGELKRHFRDTCTCPACCIGLWRSFWRPPAPSPSGRFQAAWPLR